MENAFSTRSNFLIILLLIASGCASKKDYEINPVYVDLKVITIDSLYTSTEYIPTGDSDSLFTGKKGNFDVYSILKFDTISGSYDSIFIRLKSDSANVNLNFYQVINEWFEDSLYKWEDISWLIDTSQVIQSSLVDTMNPLIKLNDETINVIDEYGIAIYSNLFYSFASREENEPRLKIYLGDSTYSLSCLGDLYIVKNPFDSILKDTLLVGRGIDIKCNIFLPVDSLPVNRDNIARAGLVMEVCDSLFFNLAAYDSGRNEYSSRNYVEGDTNFIEFDLRTLIQDDFVEDCIEMTVEAKSKLEGIGAVSLNKAELRLMWAEIVVK